MKKVLEFLKPAWDDAMWLLYAIAGVIGAAAMQALSKNVSLHVRPAHIVVAVVCALGTAGFFELKGDAAGKQKNKSRRYVYALIAGLGWQGIMPVASDLAGKIFQGVVGG